MQGADDVKHLEPLTEKIIGCAYQVSNTLGCGFLEKVYENALAYELEKSGFSVVQQQRVNVYYDEQIVGEYVADLVVADQVLVEIKSARGLDNAHLAQCLNYLRATGLKLCLLMNFGPPRVEIKRVVY